MARVEFAPDTGRSRLAQVIPLKTPYSLYVYPTNFCNFRCNYCAHSMGYDAMEKEYGFRPETMSMETYRLILEQAREFPDKLKSLNLTGQGEPLLNSRLPEMILEAKRREVAERIEFITNGSLLNRGLSERLTEAGLDCIRISLQGLSGRKYQKICGVELDFRRLTEEIAWFYQHKRQCEVYVKIMDLALDEGEEEQFYEIFSPIADRIYVEQCRPVYSGVETTRDLQSEADRYGRLHAPRRVCPLCFYMMGVFPDGSVYPCETIYRPALLGDVREVSLREIWEGQRLRQFQLAQLTGGRDSCPGCVSCCAPDDVSHPEDELDGSVEELIRRWGGEI